MERKKIQLFVFLMLSSFVYALTLPLEIYDGDLDIPLVGVHVSVQDNSNTEVLTDENGYAVLIIPDDTQFPITIICSTPGYTDTETVLKSAIASYTKENPLVIVMGLDTVLEGDELVVEGNREGKTDRKAGVPIVRTSEEMETSAQIGIVADVMTSVATLPGVGFKLGMNVEPSVRGGYPAEMGVTFDGVYMLEPFYWDGMVSILSPYMIDTVKLSTGIFSSRYGQGTSGLLDTTSIKIGDDKKLTINISTISVDAALELPLGDKNDVFLSIHATDLTVTRMGLLGALEICDVILPETEDFTIHGYKYQLETLKRSPYIYNTYAKWDITPKPEFKFSLNGLFAIDGNKMELAGIPEEETDSKSYVDLYGDYAPYEAIINTEYLNIQSFVNAQVKWMVTPIIVTDLDISYSMTKKEENTHLGTSKNYVLRNPISQKTRKSLHDNGIKVNYQIFQSASTDFLISKQERMQIPFKNSPIEIYNDTCCMSNSLN